jgi:D-aspartate ligase
MGTRLIDFDHSAPMILVKVGRYPLHHGTVGAIRSLGQVGVPVNAAPEDGFTPPARSRYLRSCVVWPTNGFEDPAMPFESLASIGRKLPRQAVALITDNEVAVLFAGGATQLSEWFVLPSSATRIAAPARKRGLYEVCCRLGVPTPDAFFRVTGDDVMSYAVKEPFRVVQKTWTRGTPAQPRGRRYDRHRLPKDVRRLAASWPERPKSGCRSTSLGITPRAGLSTGTATTPNLGLRSQA